MLGQAHGGVYMPTFNAPAQGGNNMAYGTDPGYSQWGPWGGYTQPATYQNPNYNSLWNPGAQSMQNASDSYGGLINNAMGSMMQVNQGNANRATQFHMAEMQAQQAHDAMLMQQQMAQQQNAQNQWMLRKQMHGQLAMQQGGFQNQLHLQQDANNARTQNLLAILGAMPGAIGGGQGQSSPVNSLNFAA